MNALLAAGLCLLAALRSLALATPFGFKHRLWVASVVTVSAVTIGVVFWDGYLSALPVLGILLYMFAELQSCGKRLRFIAIAPISMWLIFAVSIGSYGAMLSTSAELISNILSIYRHHFGKVKES